MKDCPANTFNQDQIWSVLSTVDSEALYFEKFDTTATVEAIKDYLIQAGLPAVVNKTDMFILYTSRFKSYLVDFSEGCSSGFYSLSWQTTVDFLKAFAGSI